MTACEKKLLYLRKISAKMTLLVIIRYFIACRFSGICLNDLIVVKLQQAG